MRDYGRVYSQFWTSPDVQRLSDDAKILALYLLTGPHTTIIGAFRLPDGYICADLNWTPERVSEGFNKLQDNRFATRCKHTNWVWIGKFLEWNPPENPNQWKAANKAVTNIPTDCLWRLPFSESYAEMGGEITTISETVEEPLPKPFRTQEQEQKQEQKGSRAAEPLVLHDSLPKPEWDEWISHRRAKRWPCDEVTLRKQLKELAKHDTATQASMLDTSMQAGWQGVFPPKGAKPKTAGGEWH